MFFGVGIDKDSRCQHYHSEVDVVALKCGQCQRYYACYECHDTLEDHGFVAMHRAELYPVLCGACRNCLSQEEYKGGSCPYCAHPFNPNCSLHDSIYFKEND